MDRIVGFYKTVFGAEVTFEMQAQPDHPHMIILDLGGGAALNIFEVDKRDDHRRAHTTGWPRRDRSLCLAVDSLATLEAVRDRLIEAGADIGEIQRLGGEWSLFFRDPDGMELEVCCHGD